MNVPIYTFANISYTYSLTFKKWEFKRENNVFLFALRGNEKAHKVAHIIEGSFRRSNQLDGLARQNISKICANNF